jgi:hypothetical protein
MFGHLFSQLREWKITMFPSEKLLLSFGAREGPYAFNYRHWNRAQC